MKTDLIFDLGMNNGDDTVYYLHLGYRVVAVEADPVLAAEVARHSAEAIASGRLVIVNQAISEQRGAADFWICEQNSVWNSFLKRVATRKGCTAHAVRVPTVPLRDLFAEHGVPHYLKVDIEGHDPIAIRDIDPGDAPRFVSMEIATAEDFILLQSKGYTRFKCVEQRGFTAVQSPRLSLRSVLSVLIARVESTPLVRRLHARYRQLRPPRPNPASRPGDWVFPRGSSGPFGDEAPGEWLTLNEALHAWLSQKVGHKLGYSASTTEVQAWFDLHATK